MRGGYGAANNFPKTADDVPSWLDALQLPQYKTAFQGMELEDLGEMKDAQLKQLIPIEGHRRRFVLALSVLLESLGSSSSSPPPKSAPSQGVQQSVKFNSTSSIYIDSTIVKPCIDEIIFCVSIVLHDRIEEGESEARDENDAGVGARAAFTNKPLFVQLAGEPLSEEVIFQTIKSIYSIAEFSAECLVISLLFIERIRSITGLQLRSDNWQPLLLAAMIVAQKVWDDKSLLNVDFSVICNAYTVKDINSLEKQFLEMIQYNVSISASLYASYYFELRTLCEKADRPFDLKPLSEQQRIDLQSRSEEKTEDMRKSRRIQSAGVDGLNVGASPRIS